MTIEILEETNKWIAISKPAGIQTELNPFGPSAESLVTEYLSRQYRNPFVGIVHRIDRPTSGLLIFAKKKGMLKQLNQIFSDRQVSKTYLAKVDNLSLPAKGKLEHWLYTDRANRKAIVYNHKKNGARLCQLEYEVLSEDVSSSQSLLEVKPLTGRYHQIRAQFAAIGSPIIGDAHYGSSLDYQPNCIMLHAWKLEIPQFDIQLETKRPIWG
jgi:23S rRNA pseudouridine1911/1915/1917 synthase